ncbi:MAG TPA: glutathione S-transferase family protein [Steroidobacteraceae bacterium]|nr:glutathione S-transferase family protein [Steroidobacteraceae bacterium]
MLELWTSEPNTFFLKPLIALHEKRAAFTARWMDTDALAHFSVDHGGETEATLHLEREGPLLNHDGTWISGSSFMLEYLAEVLPGEDLLPSGAIDRYEAHASAQFLGAHLGALVPILGCVKYLAPRLAAHDRADLERRLLTVQPLERRNSWLALIDGTYTPQILATARERLKHPVARVESRLARAEWLAGPRYSIADIDAFAMLRVIPDLAPELVNAAATPRLCAWLARIESRPAVAAALATTRSGNPAQHFVPGVEPSRWG